MKPLVWLALLTAVIGQAQVTQVFLRPEANKVEILFRGTPSPATTGMPAHWILVELDEAGAEVRRIPPEAVEITVDETVELKFPAQSLRADTQYRVVWAGAPPPAFTPVVRTLQPAPPKKKPSFVGASQRDATILLSGMLIASPGAGADLEYAWQAHLEHFWKLNRRNLFGATFDGIGRQEANLDPDSILIGSAFRSSLKRTGNSVWEYRASPLGFEFGRRNLQKSSNLISRHSLYWTPLNTNRKPFRLAKNTVLIPEITLAGVEVGDNVENYGNQPGRGLILRQTHAAKLFLYPARLADLGRASLDFEYRVLIPHRAEPFVATPGSRPVLRTNARHFMEGNVNLGLAPGISFTAKYLYGSLPPAFAFQDHQVIFGLTLAFKPGN